MTPSSTPGRPSCDRLVYLGRYTPGESQLRLRPLEATPPTQRLTTVKFENGRELFGDPVVWDVLNKTRELRGKPN